MSDIVVPIVPRVLCEPCCTGMNWRGYDSNNKHRFTLPKAAWSGECDVCHCRAWVMRCIPKSRGLAA